MPDPARALRLRVHFETAIGQLRDAGGVSRHIGSHNPLPAASNAQTPPDQATTTRGRRPRTSEAPQDTVPSRLAGASIVQYLPKDCIYHQGAGADAIFLLQEGRVKLTATSVDGKEGVLSLLASGSFLGEGCLREQSRRVNTATVMIRSTVVRIPKEPMLIALQADSALATRLMLHLLDRQSRIEEDLLDHLFNGSEKRLARALILLAGIAQSRACEVALPHLTQETLAEIVGTTRSRVSFFMNRFRLRGFVDYDGTNTLTVRHSLLTVVRDGPQVRR